METSYKEKYEQAIERLKQWDREHPCAGYVVSDRDKFIFPELEESENEKVRKELTKHLKELSNWKEDEVIPVKNPSYYRLVDVAPLHLHDADHPLRLDNFTYLRFCV